MAMAQSVHTSNMENVLQYINSKYIKLEKDKEFDNNIILHSTRRIVEYMKEEDPLFAAMFREIFFGGSYYDGLRVGKPNEFDLDLLLDIRKFGKHKFDEPSNIPGFVRLKVTEFTGYEKPEKAKKKFQELFDKDYLCIDQTFIWLEKVFHRAFNHLPGEGSVRVLETIIGDFEIWFSRKAPAFTLHIHTIDGSDYYKCGKSRDKTEVMTIDLVPCFVFTSDDWPSCGFRSNLVPKKPDFFIVPKKPKTSLEQPLERYWRLSFQQQERVLIGKQFMKSAIKLLKKLRDRYDIHHCISSYYIKTVVLYMATNGKYDESFWKRSLSSVFMAVLEEYAESIKNQNIYYFWYRYRKYNLIKPEPETPEARITLENISNNLKRIINGIKNNLDKPETVAKYLLTSEEYDSFIVDTICGEMSNEMRNLIVV